MKVYGAAKRAQIPGETIQSHVTGKVRLDVKAGWLTTLAKDKEAETVESCQIHVFAEYTACVS